jgi:hypothetical protein
MKNEDLYYLNIVNDENLKSLSAVQEVIESSKVERDPVIFLIRKQFEYLQNLPPRIFLACGFLFMTDKNLAFFTLISREIHNIKENEMKAKSRKIKVNEVVFHWAISSLNCDGDGGRKIAIYKDGIKLIERITHEKSVTPKVVSSLINSTFPPGWSAESFTQ